MKIAIDIDDTFVIHRARDTNFTLEFAKANNLDYEFINDKNLNDGIKINWTPELYEMFWTSSFGKNFYKYAVVTNKNKQIIKTLQKRGHKVYFITARNLKWQEITQNWLEKNNLTDITLIFSKNKAEICRQNKIDILIDNDLDVCKQATDIGIKTYCFNPKTSDLNDLLKIAKTGDIYEK